MLDLSKDSFVLHNTGKILTGSYFEKLEESLLLRTITSPCLLSFTSVKALEDVSKIQNV